MATDHRGDVHVSRPIELVGFGLCVANLVYLAASFVQGSWLLDANGHGLATDFVNVWAAGRLVLDGHPQAAYDWTIHKAVEEAAVGHPFEGYYAWLYPPPFLSVAAALATLPLAGAQALWSLATFTAYAATVRTIIGNRIGLMLACAFPAVVANVMVGQNGFLSASLLGLTLHFMERRPILAGCLLGLMTYKPHLGVLFPLVLIVGGHWRVFATATAMAVLLNVLAWVAFGAGTFEAFFHILPIESQAILTQGSADWGKLQTVFGLVRSLGGSESLAWALQGSLTGITALFLCAIWRTSLPFELKVGALSVGALLATPYLYMYDLAVLAVPMAFLFRIGLVNGFLRGELAGIACVSLLILMFPFVKAPVGALAVIVVAGLIARRALSAMRSNAWPWSGVAARPIG